MGAAVGAELLRAIEAAGDALYGEERAEGESQHRSAEPSGAGCSAEPPSPRQALRAAARRRADGGATSLANTILLCRHHHRLVHEVGWTVQWWGQRACFTDPRGHLHLNTGWETPELPREPSRALVRENRLPGADPGPLTPSARWKRERYVPDVVWFRADEAGLEGSPP